MLNFFTQLFSCFGMNNLPIVIFLLNLVKLITLKSGYIITDSVMPLKETFS